VRRAAMTVMDLLFGALFVFLLINMFRGGG
jgi:hypothetical protein